MGQHVRQVFHSPHLVHVLFAGSIWHETDAVLRSSSPHRMIDGCYGDSCGYLQKLTAVMYHEILNSSQRKRVIHLWPVCYGMVLFSGQGVTGSIMGSFVIDAAMQSRSDFEVTHRYMPFNAD